jgi:hypothetical protein
VGGKGGKKGSKGGQKGLIPKGDGSGPQSQAAPLPHAEDARLALRETNRRPQGEALWTREPQLGGAC